jgi:hypothetical protein
MSDVRDDDIDKPDGAVPPWPKPVDEDQSPIELLSEMAPPEPAHPGELALEELKTEVLSAVRGAITGVMNRHQPTMPEPDLDLDFSYREPVAATAPVSDEVFTPPTTSKEGPSELSEPATTPLADDPLVISLLDVTASQRVAIVQALPPVIRRNEPLRHWPAWPAATLLSMAGIAIGAGAAILLIDPSSTAVLRERITSTVESLADVTAAHTNDGTTGPALDNPPPTDIMAGTSGLPELGRTHVPNSDPILAESDDPTSRTAHADASTSSSLPLGTRHAGAPVIPIDPTADGQAALSASLRGLAILSVAATIKIAIAADAATFATDLEQASTAGASATGNGRTAGTHWLAALPPTAVSSASQATGAEVIPPAPVPLAVKPTIVVLPEFEPVPVPEIAAVPLSTMARANEALRNGKVTAARMLLQSESEAGQVEAMLALARSFDPSYLAQIGIPASEGKADVAEKLYRAWYQRSVELGLVSEGINLNRLIRAMARVKP